MKKYDYRYWILPGIIDTMSIIFIIYSSITGNLKKWIDIFICLIIFNTLYIINDILDQKRNLKKAKK